MNRVLLIYRGWWWVPVLLAVAASTCAEDGVVAVYPMVVVGLLALLGVALPIDSAGASMWPALGMRSVGVLGPPWWVRRGDLCVVRTDEGPWLTKRLAAVAGDVVERRDGRVWVGGVAQPLVADVGQLDVDPPTSGTSPVTTTVPAGHVWLLGDHVSSMDSRHFGPVPADRVAGAYWPIVHWGRPRPFLLPEADLADLDHLRRLEPPCPHLDQLEAVLAAGGCEDAQARLVLRWCLLAAGAHDRLVGSLTRGRDASADLDDRALWVILLVRCLVDGGDLGGAIAVLDGEPALLRHPDHGQTLGETRASLLARSARYEEALAAADEVEGRFGADGFLAGRLSALVGLGRLAEAAAEIAAITARGSWGDPCWEPWYRACLASVAGDQVEAARFLGSALDAGFPDLELVSATPHLAALRASPPWEGIAARLDPRA